MRMPVALPLGLTLPGGRRPLHDSELAQARSVYGNSIDYAVVVVTGATGINRRPFTSVLPRGAVAMNLGTGAFQEPGTHRDVLIHELAHVWQSQHHRVRAQFMLNSVLSQTGAAARGASAYCYVPGREFGAYAAEQIAQQAQHGVASITAHMRAVFPGVPDVANAASLASPRWERRDTPDVVCPG